MSSKPLDNAPKKYIYKFDNKNKNNNNNNSNKTPEYQPPSAVAVTKRIISSTVWALRKSKSKQKSDGITNDNIISKNVELEITAKGKNGKEFPYTFLEENNSKGKIVEEKSRKSISHVENSYYSKNSNNGKKGYVVEKGRKSTGVKVESNVGKAVELLQVKVLVTDMPAFMQIHAFQCARITFDSLEVFSAKHLASNLKKEFDKIYGPAWHCIVGSSFGSFVTHATGCFLYFSMEKLCILLFRTKVQRAVQQ